MLEAFSQVPWGVRMGVRKGNEVTVSRAAASAVYILRLAYLQVAHQNCLKRMNEAQQFRCLYAICGCSEPFVPFHPLQATHKARN